MEWRDCKNALPQNLESETKSVNAEDAKIVSAFQLASPNVSSAIDSVRFVSKLMSSSDK